MSFPKVVKLSLKLQQNKAIILHYVSFVYVCICVYNFFAIKLTVHSVCTSTPVYLLRSQEAFVFLGLTPS